MINVTLFSSVAFIYLFSSLLYFCYFFFRKEKVGKAATAVMVVGLIVQTIAYGMRWVESYQSGVGHSPFSFFTLYETLVFACWSAAIVYFVIEYKYQMRMLGAIILPLISLGMLYASLSPGVTGDIGELPAVLQGNLFAYHVISCMASLVAFLISFVASILILMMEKGKRSFPLLKNFLARFPAPGVLDTLSYKTIAIGFILFSIGMATGAYRTKIIWGNYWSWDPVETSALIMWLLYAIVLHGRYQRWWGMRTSSMLSAIAFSVSILCFLVAGSYLLASGHYPII